jgi:hypothetical protein
MESPPKKHQSNKSSLMKHSILITLALLTTATSQAQTTSATGLRLISFHLKDSILQEAIPFANVRLYQNGVQKYVGTTDFDGNAFLRDVPDGNYDLRFDAIGYNVLKVQNTESSIAEGRYAYLIVLRGSSIDAEAIETLPDKVPRIDLDGGASGATVTREDVARMPSRAQSRSERRADRKATRKVAKKMR